MAEGTYEYECMRAELLGIEKPNYDEFVERQKQAQALEVEEDEQDTENLKELDSQNEGMTTITSKLGELNSILTATQKKINRFKNSYGSLASSLRSKIGFAGSSESVNSNSASEIAAASVSEPEGSSQELSEGTLPQKKAAIADAMDSQIDKLDSMIQQAETAHYNMEHQRKQMKAFLK